MGDIDYITAFQQIILPIAYEFNPELVLVSAGFDAAIGDPIGNYNVTPEAYAYFTHWLSSLANGKIILCLEGGYNVNSISHAMAMCTKALLGDPLPMLQNNKKPTAGCIETIQKVLSVQKKYWKSLKFNKKLPSFIDTADNDVDALTNTFKTMNCTDSDDSKRERKSNDNGNGDNDCQPGPSKPIFAAEKKQTLLDYLSENREALFNEEMFAVLPLKNCPHLSSLDPTTAPSGNIFAFGYISSFVLTSDVFFFFVFQ